MQSKKGLKVTKSSISESRDCEETLKHDSFEVPWGGKYLSNLKIAKIALNNDERPFLEIITIANTIFKLNDFSFGLNPCH